MEKQKFALYIANRGTFPQKIIESSIQELTDSLNNSGYDYILPPKETTANGAFTTAAEGEWYAKWLKQHEGEYDGVIISLPNFGDENGAIAAMYGVTTPIFIHAFPDEEDKMDCSSRRDAFCGKISIMNTLRQCGIKFTISEPHTVSPRSVKFQKNIDDFATVCRVVKGMKKFSIGLIGARSTPFKTVRFDEITLQKLGITVETCDLSELFLRVQKLDGSHSKVIEKKKQLTGYSDCSCVTEEALDKLSCLGVAIDDMISEYRFDCIGIRCWTEIQQIINVAPCLILSELNDRMTEACCETDACNAVIMRALRLASGTPSACMDWNNNYKEEDDKCILFHCGPTANSLMKKKGKVTNHVLLAAPGKCCYGSNEGRLAGGGITYCSAITENGEFKVYIGEGKITEDAIDNRFFGSAGVVQIDSLQKKMIGIGKNGFRHHMVFTQGLYEAPMREAFVNYLGYKMIEI